MKGSFFLPWWVVPGPKRREDRESVIRSQFSREEIALSGPYFPFAIRSSSGAKPSERKLIRKLRWRGLSLLQLLVVFPSLTFWPYNPCCSAEEDKASSHLTPISLTKVKDEEKMSPKKPNSSGLYFNLNCKGIAVPETPNIRAKHFGYGIFYYGWIYDWTGYR